MTLRLLVLAFGLLVPRQEAAVKPFIGAWELDGFRGALPFAFHGERAVCGARSAVLDREVPDGSVPASEFGQQYMGPLNGSLTFKLHEDVLTIERRYDGYLGKNVLSADYSLAGTETSSTSDGVTLRAKAVVSGNKLSLSGTVTLPGVTATCSLNEIFEVDGAFLQVTATGDSASDELVARQTYIKKK